MMILAFDTYYYNDKARTVCFCFEKFSDDEPKSVYTDIVSGIEEYESGAFYKRELPCIIRLLEKYHLTDIDMIIIDGFVVLDDNNTIGLGGRLFEYLGGSVPVIGVAKRNFSRLEKNKREIYRGKSRNPLYITALGIDLDAAGEHIKNMKGKYRMPTLLKNLDISTKQNL